MGGVRTRGRRARALVWVAIACAWGCGSAPPGEDAAVAPRDGGVDAASVVDAGADAGTDAAMLVADVGADAPSTPSVSVSPTPFSFGTLIVGCTSLPQTFTVGNHGGATLGAVTVGIGGLDASEFALASDGCSGRSLAPGATCTVDVVYHPTTAGDHGASLDVTAGGGASAHAALGGRALVPAGPTLLPATRSFGVVPTGATGPTLDFTFRRWFDCPGVTDHSITSALSGAGADQFHIVGTTCDAAVPVGGTCTISVAFAPTVVGLATASLVVTSGGVWASATLTGTGAAPELTLSPGPEFNFGAVDSACRLPTQTFTLTNTGAASIGGITVALVGLGASQFAIERDACAGSVLGGISSCTFDVTVRPTSLGAVTAVLQITSDGGSIGADIAATLISAARFSFTSGVPVRFGTVAVGTSSSLDVGVAFTCDSTSTTSITAAISGASADQFRLDASACTAAPLAGGSTCTITVTFAPTTTGTAAGELDVSATPGGMVSAPLVGTGG